jgi:hypothetical protein
VRNSWPRVAPEKARRFSHAGPGFSPLPQGLKRDDDTKVCGDEILCGENLTRLGSLINPKYPQLSEHYHPVREGEVESHWIERNVLFNLRRAVERRLVNEPKLDAARGK